MPESSFFLKSQELFSMTPAEPENPMTSAGHFDTDNDRKNSMAGTAFIPKPFFKAETIKK